ncbi:DUF3106 domain-containing protein [Thiomonas bhubaneswarensis]|uniref:DUF3106 domain-containing protein n=1 Tax=Thiomonas bhubaneswarensis TaxID=339866 RepID=A0A0K6I902_9BURK|nr:DUF3106 domain-containing protein [Thiomonas bhubaneswarensis]CUA99595.1 Protein of unknown function (DUF3106) [Thiomonas bhubaneswarensis]
MAIRPESRGSASCALRGTWVGLCIALAGATGLAPLASANQRDGQGGYQRWERMPPQQRERILQEQERFKRLPPSEQERLRREYEQQRR